MEKLFDGVDSPVRKATRIALLMARGLGRADALIVDESFSTAMERVLDVVNETVDGATERLKAYVLMHTLTGVTTNLEVITEQVQTAAMEVALQRGVRLDTGGDPDCDCDVCTAVRAHNAALNEGTRH